MSATPTNIAFLICVVVTLSLPFCCDQNCVLCTYVLFKLNIIIISETVFQCISPNQRTLGMLQMVLREVLSELVK